MLLAQIDWEAFIYLFLRTSFYLLFTRFAKKRIEEELEVSRRKLSLLKAQNEGCSVIEKLQQELGEYREIVKCSICQDRTKEVHVFLSLFKCAVSYLMGFKMEVCKNFRISGMAWWQTSFHIGGLYMLGSMIS